MSTGFANTNLTSSLIISSSSSAHARTNGSLVATVSVKRSTATGRMRNRSAYAFDIVAVTAPRSIFSGSMWKYGTLSRPASHSTSVLERQQLLRRLGRLPVLRGDQLERVLVLPRARARELLRIGRRHQAVGHHELQDVVEAQAPVGLLLRRAAGGAAAAGVAPAAGGLPLDAGSGSRHPAILHRGRVPARCARRRPAAVRIVRVANPEQWLSVVLEPTSPPLRSTPSSTRRTRRCWAAAARRRHPARSRPGARRGVPGARRMSYRRGAHHAGLSLACPIRDPHGRPGVARRPPAGTRAPGILLSTIAGARPRPWRARSRLPGHQLRGVRLSGRGGGGDRGARGAGRDGPCRRLR